MQLLSCPSCGHQVPVGDKFCGQCGNRMEEGPKPAGTGKTMFFSGVQMPGRAKLILVLGHTHCGAIKGACD